MTSRVREFCLGFYSQAPFSYACNFTEKGSTVFRPVVKSRQRAAPSSSRQPSSGIELTTPLSGDLEPLGPSQPDSSLFSSPDNLQGTFSGQETTPILSTRPENGESVQDVVATVFESHSIPVRKPTAPPVVGSPATGSIRSRSSVPMVIATPRTSHTRPSSFSVNIPQSEASRTAIEISQLPSISNASSASAALVPSGSAGPSSVPDIPYPVTPAAASNPAAPAPGEQESPATVAPQKRKTPSRSTKASKKRKNEAGDAEDNKNSQERPSSKRARSRASSRASSSTPRPRKRGPTPPSYDPDADPGEDLDPTAVTMAELCSDTGQGRVSRKAAEILSNHAAWKAKNREKRARMKQVMEAKKYGREEELENTEEGEPRPETQAATTNEASSTTPAITDDSGNGFDYTQDLATSRFNVQVRIGPNGETVIDEESLVVDRAENDGTENYTHVIESDQTKFVNSGSYGKKYRGSRWSADETELFYDVSPSPLIFSKYPYIKSGFVSIRRKLRADSICPSWKRQKILQK